MPRKPFRLGGRVFESRAQELIGSILGSYGVGDRVSDEHGALLRDLIRLHPQADEKFGPDLSHFVVDIHSESSHATPHFVAVHARDVSEHFSYRHCIHPLTAFDDAIRAMRNEVTGDILDAKHKYFEQPSGSDGRIPCRVTGKLMTFDQCQADHALSLSFYVLSRTFMAHEEVDWQNIGCDFVIDGARIGLAGLRMRDRDLARRWRHYHHTLAAMRLVRAEVNQSLSSASRVRAGDRQLNLAPYLVEPEPPEEPDDDERECGCTCDSPAQWSSPTRGRAEVAASHPWISSFRRSAIRPTGATPATSRPTR